MKKIFRMTSILLIFVVSLSLAACSFFDKPENHEHSFANEWTTTDAVHYHAATCEHDVKADEASHTFIWVVDKDATTEEEGLKHEECSVCGYKRNENTAIDKLACPHELVLVEAKDATCMVAGNYAYYTCNLCEKYYSDNQAQVEITLESTIIAKLDTHSLGEYVIEEAASTTTEGLMKACCVVDGCDYAETKKIMTTPIVSYVDEMLIWEEVIGAESYDIYANGELLESLGDELTYQVPFNTNLVSYSVRALTTTEGYYHESMLAEGLHLQSTLGTNETPRGDFELFTQNESLNNPSNWTANGVVFVEGSSVSSEIIVEDNNAYYKAYNPAKPCIEFDLYANDAFKQAGNYLVSMQVKLGAGATNVNTIGFRFWGDPRPTEADYNFDLTGINSDGWTTITTTVEIFAPCNAAWINMFFWVFTHDDEINSVDNYVLIDNIKIQKIETQKICLHEKVSVVNRVKATCSQNGNIEHYHCNDCNLNFSDEACNNVIADVVIPTLGHNYTYEITLAPTASSEGSAKGVCSCGHEIDLIIMQTPTLELNGSLGWNEISGATSYEIYANDELLGTTAELSYLLPARLEITAYTVKAISTNEMYKRDSEVSNVLYIDSLGVNETPRGDFELFTQNESLNNPSNWTANGVVFVEGSSVSSEIIVEDNNAYYKAYNPAKPCIEFDLYANDAFKQAGNYLVSMQVKLGAGATNVNTIGFRFWGDPRPTEADYNFDLTGINSDGWTTITTTVEIFAPCNAAWINMFFWVFTHDDEINSVDNYVLIDNIKIQKVEFKTVCLHQDVTFVNRVEASCTENGNIAYYHCNECNLNYLDELCKVLADNILINALGHTYSDTLSSDENNHYYLANCGHNEQKDVEAHQFSWVIDQVATVLETGLKHEECSVCSYKRNLNTVIEKLACTHEMVVTDAKEASCVLEGNIKYYTCAHCHKLYQDEEGLIEISLADTVIAKLTTHSVGEYVITINPTTENEGRAEAKCSVNGCSYVETKKVLATPNISIDGYKITWNEVLNATGYQAVMDNKIEPLGEVLEYYVTIGKDVSICAYTDNMEYLSNSLASSVISYSYETNSLASGSLENTMYAYPKDVWTWHYLNWAGNGDIRNILLGENTAVRLKTTADNQNIILTSALGDGVIKAGDYKVYMDIMKGSQVDGKLMFGIIAGETWALTQDNGVFDLTNVSSEEFTTVSINYSVASDIICDWANADIMYQTGIHSDDNYILLDNIRVVKVVDGVETRVDTNPNYDFEIDTRLNTAGWHACGQVYTEASTLENRLVEENGNTCLKVYTNGDCAEFNLNANGSVNKVGYYKVSLKVKLGEGATNMGAIGFRIWGAPNRPTQLDTNFDISNLKIGEWVTLEAVVYMDNLTGDWANMFFWVFTNNSALQNPLNYVLIDDVTYQYVNLVKVN